MRASVLVSLLGIIGTAACGSSAPGGSVGPSDGGPHVDAKPLKDAASDGPGPTPADAQRDVGAAYALAFTTLSTADKQDLTAIWAASETDVWITTDNTGGGYGRVMHATDGATFLDVGSAGAFAGLYGVWGSSSSNVYVAGGDRFGGSGVLSLLRWDGTQLIDESHATGVAGTYFNGVFGTSMDDVYVVGEAALVHWSAGGFVSGGSATTHLEAAWGSAPGQYVFVGTNGWVQTLAPGSGTEVGTGSTLNAVAGSSASDVWAVGDNGLVMHYDGTTWKQVDAGTTNHLHGVWVDAPDSVFVVGWQATVLHWNGSTWSPVAVNPDATSGSFNAVFGITGKKLWVAGAGGLAIAAPLP